jgi:integrase
MTFDQCAAAYIKTHRADWNNKKHAKQWESTLATYASPVFGKLPVVFPGARAGKPLSDRSLFKTLPRMGRDDLTTHGFRSTFRDWCGDHTEFPREVAEAALAHAIGDSTEAAYRRSDALQRVPVIVVHNQHA